MGIPVIDRLGRAPVVADCAENVVDADSGEPIACRMHLKNAKGQPQKAGAMPFWKDHFVFPGKVKFKLPKGTYSFELERGPEYVDRKGYFTIDDFADDFTDEFALSTR